MPGGHTKFNNGWLTHIDSNAQTLGVWCRKGKDDFHAYCRFCDIQIKCDNSGKQQVLQHAKKDKHKQAIKYMQDDKQSKLVFKSEPTSTNSSSSSATPKLDMINYSDASLVAQIYWMAKMASCNFSLRSCDHLGGTFHKMFPDSKIAAQFSLSRTGASYMISEGMAPYFRKVIVEDLDKSNLPFSMHFDETSTAQVKKQMDLTLRYWSPTHNKVWVTFYTSLFFGHAEGEKVASKMFEQLAADNIPMNRLVTLVRDGPNVNKTVMRKLQELIREQNPEFGGFVDLGSCVLHIVHNAFGKGLEKYGKDIDQLCLDLHSLFKYSAARREDYAELQLALDVEMHTFQQHTEVRWLSIGPAIQRILEQWDAICKFIQQLSQDGKNSPKSINYKRASALLTGAEKDNTKVMLEFLNSAIPLFEGFLTLFQRSGPTVHIVYDSMCQSLLKIMRRFMKSSALEGKYGTELTGIPCSDVSLQASDAELNIGDGTRKALAQLKPDKQKSVLLGVRAFYAAAVSHMQTRLPFDNTLLRDLGCLNPSKRSKRSTVISVQNIARKLQPQLDISIVQDEWKVYQADIEVDTLQENLDIEEYWKAIFQLRGIDGASRYESLPLVVKASLVLAQTNAESERSLSINARVVTKERASLGETTIVGLRSVKEAVRFYDPVNLSPENITVTKELKLSVRLAHSAYQARLEEEKIELERKKEEVRRKKEEEDRKEKEKEKLLETKNTLAKREERLAEKESNARADLNVADELMNDATSKLHDALSCASVSKQSVNVATMMLDAAKNKRQQAMQQLDTIRKEQKTLEGKTHQLLEKAIPQKPHTAKNKSSDRDKMSGATSAKKAKKDDKPHKSQDKTKRSSEKS